MLRTRPRISQKWLKCIEMFLAIFQSNWISTFTFLFCIPQVRSMPYFFVLKCIPVVCCAMILQSQKVSCKNEKTKMIYVESFLLSSIGDLLIASKKFSLSYSVLFFIPQWLTLLLPMMIGSKAISRGSLLTEINRPEEMRIAYGALCCCLGGGLFIGIPHAFVIIIYGLMIMVCLFHARKNILWNGIVCFVISDLFVVFEDITSIPAFFISWPLYVIAQLEITRVVASCLSPTSKSQK